LEPKKIGGDGVLKKIGGEGATLSPSKFFRLQSTSYKML